MTTNRAPSITGTLSGRHLVVTGATGFVGKVWLSHLLCHVPDVGRVTLLVRGSRKEPALTRVARLIDTSPAFRPLRDRHGVDLGAWLDGRLDVVDADITKPGCGLTDDVAERLASTADVLVHIAGLTDFQPDPRKALAANVDGTRHAAQLAQRFRAPRVVHVSTAFVAGRRDGRIEEELTPGVSPLRVPFDVEEELAAARALCTDGTADERIERVAARARALGWPNLYTYSKGLAEHLLASLPVELTIVRPTVVECARSFPFVGWNEGLNTSGPILWYCGTVFRGLPSTAAHTFDVVPVDAVARALTVVTARHVHGIAPVVHHVGTSDHNPASFGRIVELTALAKRRHVARGGGDVWAALEASLDVVPHAVESSPLVTPARVESWGKTVHGWLGKLRRDRPDEHGHTRPSSSVDTLVRDAQRSLAKTNRRMGQLRKMLDSYRPFLHDHDWTFVSANIRSAWSDVVPAERGAFAEDLSTLDWRHYWLDVQYPGIVKWAFPLMDGEEVPEDPPSVPLLVLRGAEAAWADTAAAAGVA